MWTTLEQDVNTVSSLNLEVTDASRYESTISWLKGLFAKGRMTTKCCEDSFSSLARLQAANRGCTNMSYARVYWTLVANQLRKPAPPLLHALTTTEDESQAEQTVNVTYAEDDPFGKTIKSQESAMYLQSFFRPTGARIFMGIERARFLVEA